MWKMRLTEEHKMAMVMFITAAKRLWNCPESQERQHSFAVMQALEELDRVFNPEPEPEPKDEPEEPVSEDEGDVDKTA
jgi:hypothetical protein